MKRICLGDLHGDIMLYRKIKGKFPDHKLTLVGDLVDSFRYSRTDQFQLLEEILNDIEAGITECIIGNHEWSYLLPERMRCSGFSGAFAAKIHPLKSRMFKLMQKFIFDESYPDPILFTHAGLSSHLLEDVKEGPKFDLVTFLEKDVRDLDHGLSYNIGQSRGGPDKFGGIYWCDFHQDFVPIEGLRQVFGHTEVDEIVEIALGNYNINCLQREQIQVLKIDDNGQIVVLNVTCNSVIRRFNIRS